LQGKVSWDDVCLSDDAGDERRREHKEDMKANFNDLERFSVQKMTMLLRDTKAGVGRDGCDPIPTIASQVSPPITALACEPANHSAAFVGRLVVS